MSRTKIDPVLFFSAEDAVAIRVEPEHVFGLLTRGFTPPREVAGLVRSEQGDRVAYGPGKEIRADGAKELLLVRVAAMTLTFDVRVTSLDHYRCEASVRLRVSPIPDSGELSVFDRALIGSRDLVRVEHLERYLLPHVQQAVALVAEGRGVGVLIEAGSGETIAAEVAEGLKKAAFSGGLHIDLPVTVRLDSMVYRQVRQSRLEAKRRAEDFAAQDRIRQAAAESRTRHSENLARLLTDLKAKADASPDVGLPDLLRAFGEQDRGELYAALIGADEAVRATRSVVVGTGGELLFFSPDSFEAPYKRVPMPDRIGAVRSVQAFTDADGERSLFVGASSGLYEFSADGDGKVWTYPADPGAGVRGGVNSVALVGDRVFASHSELGLLYWTRRQTTMAECLLPDRTRECSAIRCVRFFDGYLYFSLDDRVCRLSTNRLDEAPEEFVGSGATVTAVFATHDAVFAGNADGKILRWAADERQTPEIVHAGRQRPAESVSVLDNGGLPRLIYTDTSPAVFARVIGDTFSCRYEAGGQTLRRVEAAADLIVATNEVRDRLICWKPGCPDKPGCVVQVSRLSGHSIQDVCLVPEA